MREARIAEIRRWMQSEVNPGTRFQEGVSGFPNRQSLLFVQEVVSLATG